MNKNKNERKNINTDEEFKNDNISFGHEDDLVAGEKYSDDDLSPPEDLNLKLQLEKENSIALTKMLQQLQADFSNYRKRNANLAVEAKQKGINEAVEALLPAYDALYTASKQITDEETLKGLEMIEREFLNNLSSLGIEPIQSLGVKYDPQLHNVVFAEECKDVESGFIIEEFKRGFKNANGVVRVAMVKIAK